MNQSEKPKFEQEWQRAFESAAETPPPAAWNAIEKRLDAQETAVVPLWWWKNPQLWYAAAAVAALLLVSWPILETYNKDGGETATRLAVENPSPPGLSDQVELPSVATPGVATPDLVTTDAVSKENERMVKAGNTDVTPVVESPLATSKPFERIAIGGKNQPDAARQNSTVNGKNLPAASADSPSLAEVSKDAGASSAETKIGQSKTLLNATPTPSALVPPAPTVIVITQTTRKIPAGAEAADELNRVIMGSSTVPLRTKALTQSIAALSPVDGLAKLDVSLPQPFINNDLEITNAARPKHSRVREFWAGLGLMPAAFNPKINVTSAPRAFANANAGRQSLSNASQARLSYAVQAQAGKQLSKHWSVETGVSYLQGNSTFASDGYVLDAVTSQSTNVLENALYSNSVGFNNSSKSQGIAPNFDLSTGSYIDFEQRTSNDYRYVQLPVQAGYTLNPDGKLNYTVLGGVVANLFLQNEIKNKAGYVSANTADDGLYRVLNWSAATGVRVNYRLSDHWNASLTGSYQKAIASILKGDGVLESRPQLYGMSWGVRYVF